VERGKEKELAVVLTGRATKYPIANFEGEWLVLNVEALLSSQEAAS
jgi:hypothetical protein